MNGLENKTVLVTGATGFIGKHLVARLAGIPGIKLFLLSRQKQQEARRNVIVLNGALESLTPEYWRSHGIERLDYVFHLGGYIPKISADADHVDAVVDSNIMGTRRLLQSLPACPEKIIFSSTVDVYSLPAKGVLTESSRVSPRTLYGASKLFCESLISAWAKDRGCHCVILRYGHIYGPGEEAYGKLIPVVIRTLLEGRSPTLHGDGSALRDYLYVGDAVEATIRAALVEGSCGPINVVRGISVSMKDVVQLLLRLVESDKEIIFLPDRPNGDSLRFDNGLMAAALGNCAMTDLTDGLAAEIAGFRRMRNERQ